MDGNCSSGGIPTLEGELPERTVAGVEVLVILVQAGRDDTARFDRYLKPLGSIHLGAGHEQKLITLAANDHDVRSHAMPVGGDVGAFPYLEYVNL